MKVVFITGGSSGIGAEAAKLFANEGYAVAISYNTNKDGADSVVREIEEGGGKALAVQANLIHEEEARRAIESVIEAYGRIDVLVNNAGRYVEGDTWDGSGEVWLASLQQNLLSALYVSKYVLPHFMEQRSGVMINIASRLGHSGGYDEITYGAAKAGIINITQAYAKLLAPFGRANSVSPSATHAGYWLTAPRHELEATLAARPSHTLVDPKTVAQKIVFLASDEAKEISGKDFPVTE